MSTICHTHNLPLPTIRLYPQPRYDQIRILKPFIKVTLKCQPHKKSKNVSNVQKQYFYSWLWKTNLFL